ncbi:MAG: glycine dehydrogenase subunit 2, partial [Halolamina sp.]
GVHPPTTNWPEMVPEAMLTEPTEIESKQSLDDLAAAFNKALRSSEDERHDAPSRTTAKRIDQTSAAREPRLSWQALEE